MPENRLYNVAYQRGHTRIFTKLKTTIHLPYVFTYSLCETNFQSCVYVRIYFTAIGTIVLIYLEYRFHIFLLKNVHDGQVEFLVKTKERKNEKSKSHRSCSKINVKFYWRAKVLELKLKIALSMNLTVVVRHGFRTSKARSHLSYICNFEKRLTAKGHKT